MNPRLKSLRLRYSMDAGSDGEGFTPSGGDGGTNALGGVAPPAAPAEGENPAWASALEKFPEGLRGVARETFSEWDRNTQAKFNQIHEQYKPFKPFLDQGLDPEWMQQAVTVAQQLETDPEGFTRTIAQHLGLTFAEAQQAIEDATGAGTDTGETDPRLVELQQSQAALIEMFQQQEQARQFEQLSVQAEQSLTSELAQLEATHGKMTDVVRNEVLQRALMMNAATGQPASLEDAYASLEQFVSQIRSVPRPGAMAPRVIPSGSSVPAPPAGKSLGSMSSAEAKQYAADIAARYMTQQ